MTTKRRLLALIIGLILSHPCRAETLQNIYELAIANDPSLAAAEAEFKSTDEVVIQRRAQLLPSVSITANSAKSHVQTITPVNVVDLDATSPTFGQLISVAPDPNRFNSRGWGASLQQPLFRLDSWFRFKQSKDIAEQAKADFASAQQDLIYRVADRYLRILEAEESLASSMKEMSAVERQWKQAQERFDVGLVAITDVLEAQAAYDGTRVTVIEREGTQNSSFKPLQGLTGHRIQEVNVFRDDLPIVPPDPRNLDAWVNAALEQNYSLIAARERVEAAKKDISIAKAARMPTLTGTLSYSTNATGGGNSFFGSENTNKTAALALNIPVFQGGSISSSIRQADQDYIQAQKNLELQNNNVVQSVEDFFTAILTDVARIRVRLESIRSSKAALDATQKGYELGTRNISEVIQTQRELFLSQLQYANARYTYIRNNLRLKQAVGTLDPKDIYDLNNFLGEEKVTRNSSRNVRSASLGNSAHGAGTERQSRTSLARPAVNEPTEKSATTTTAVVDSRIAKLAEAIQDNISRDRLSRPEGDNALDKISQIFALDPDSQVGREAKQDVIDRYIAMARQDRGDRGKGYLEIARELAVDDRSADSAWQEIYGSEPNWQQDAPSNESRSGAGDDTTPDSSARDSAARIASLAEAIQDNISRDRLSRPEGDNALDKINQIFALDPDSQVGREAKQDVIDRYIAMARQDRGDRGKGYLEIARELAVDDRSADSAWQEIYGSEPNWQQDAPSNESRSGAGDDTTPDSSARDSAARIASLAEAIQDNISRDRLSRPEGDNALDKINQIFALDPDSQVGREAKQDVIDRYIAMARQDRGDRGKGYLEIARELAVDDRSADSAWQEIYGSEPNWQQDAPSNESRSGAGDDTTPDSSARDSAARIASLAEAIQDNISRDRLSRPEGDNALDKISQIFTINPESPVGLAAQLSVVNRFIELAYLRRGETGQEYLTKAHSLDAENRAVDQAWQEIYGTPPNWEQIATH